MVIITCKKCGEDVDMPSRRFKLCLSCNTRVDKIKKSKNVEKNKKTTQIKQIKQELAEVIESNSSDLFNIIPDHVIREISSYLTISEIYNLSRTSREYKSILSETKMWKNVITRDFSINYEFVEDIYPNVVNFAHSLDTCQICHVCLLFDCEKGCTNFNKKVSKTDCLKNYKLTEIELKNVKCDVRYHYIYKKDITLYYYKDLMKFISNKHVGFTNYSIYQANLELIREQKRLKRIENAQRKLREFENWKEGYLQTFDYTGLSNFERRELLDEYLLQHDMERREDSQLCQSFISGNVLDKSIEHIAAILKLTQILFSYSHIVYSNFHENCKIALEIKKCENDLKQLNKNKKNNKNNTEKNSKRLKNKLKTPSSNYTWFDAVNDVHDKYRRDFERYEDNYYHYGYAGHHWNGYEDDVDYW